MTISVTFDADSGLYELMCHVKGMSATPAGPRIFRIPKRYKPGEALGYPVVKFQHETWAAAEVDADLIRHYLANLPEKKISKKETQQQGD